jgi:hypothetical protein
MPNNDQPTGIVRCRFCTYWRESLGDMGTCRRKTPSVLNLPRGPATVWPGTNPDDGCGEGQIRPGVGHEEGTREQAPAPLLMPEGLADEAPR